MEVVEPWIDVSSACPAGRERLRPDILSFSVSASLSLFRFRSLCLSSLSRPPSFRSPVRGSLIRRERGDNSSPSLSLGDSPRTPSVPRRRHGLVTSPNCDRAPLVSVSPPINAPPARQARCRRRRCRSRQIFSTVAALRMGGALSLSSPSFPVCSFCFFRCIEFESERR